MLKNEILKVFEENYSIGITKGEVIELVGNKLSRVFIELGASNGEDTEHFLSRLSADDRYIAVEADPRNIQRFKIKNDSRLKLIHAAISDRNDPEGSFLMNVGIIPSLGRPHYDGSSTRLPTDETIKLAPWMKFENIKVPYITLDKIVKDNQLDRVDFVWCDVEGATGEVIAGGKQALHHTRYFYTEINEKDAYSYKGQKMYPEIVKMMNEANFELLYKFRGDALFRNKSL